MGTNRRDYRRDCIICHESYVADKYDIIGDTCSACCWVIEENADKNNRIHMTDQEITNFCLIEIEMKL